MLMAIGRNLQSQYLGIANIFPFAGMNHCGTIGYQPFQSALRLKPEL